MYCTVCILSDCPVPENIHTSPMEGIFSKNSSLLWKFKMIKLYTFLLIFDLREPPPPPPQEISIPSVGGVRIFSGTAH